MGDLIASERTEDDNIEVTSIKRKKKEGPYCYYFKKGIYSFYFLHFIYLFIYVLLWEDGSKAQNY